MMTPRTRATLRVGDTGSFSKTITEKDVFEFADATGDFNPLHIDEEGFERHRPKTFASLVANFREYKA